MASFEIDFRPARPVELPYAIEIDEAASELYRRLGLDARLPDEHPFVMAERERWRQAAERGDLWFAAVDDEPIGFSSLGSCDGHAELEQLAVMPEYGRRRIGRALLERAVEACRARGRTELWLTTYDHVPWNAAFYERVGFERMPEAACGPHVRATLAAQRAVLLAPEHRIAMRRWL